ncbi:type II toxin-antitoxin system RelE/ParE family toxin [Candidatus Saccharibacteria bacterium]|nr:type II toxin-antitoxin system RelE/ParE family toxin [Candidatus Saccharibacteria bacterium]
MTYKLIIAKAAKLDLTDISAYITRELHALQAALDLLDELERQMSLLKEMPKKFALVPDERLALCGIRKVSVKNYIVFYTVDDQAKTVNVVRILYGRRDWAHLL